MKENGSEKSFGELPTLGQEETVKPERTAPEGPSWTELGLSEVTTQRPPEGAGGIVDDGRTDAARRWKAGETILDRYVVEGELGQGGMGVVYGCLDKVGGVRVAVKCLPPELGHNSVEMEEVRENFGLVCGLAHPNIAVVRQLEKDGKGEYYLVMELAEGESLRRWLRRKWKAGGVSLAEAVGVLRQVASALDYAHGMKVIHRDVKPGNVMIDGEGRVKVLDFGLAAQVRTSLSRASHAYRGTSGTGPYMAPEQWRGRPQDGKADQYALGVMAYEMLAGRLPFENDDVSVLREVVLKEEPEAIPGLPEKVMAVLRRAMAKRAEDRFGSCGEFVEALEGKRKAGWAGAGGGGGRRSARGRTLMGWAVALAVLAGAVVWWKGSGERARQDASLPIAGGMPAPRQEDAEAARLAEQRKAEAARLAEEARKSEEELLAKQKAAEEAAARLAAEQKAREEARQATEEAERKRAEAERRAQEAEEARKVAETARQKAEEDAARHQRELEERLAKLEEKVSSPAVRAEGTETARPVHRHLPTGQEGSSQQGSRAGEPMTVRVGAWEVALRWCPAGTFTMGSPSGEDGRFYNETQHRVTLSQGFWMGETEVTQGLWREVMKDNPASFKNGDNYPVDSVSWEDCQKFVQTLNSRYSQDGMRWALPTEAQWEYACRAGSTGAYGETGRLGDVGWFPGNSGGQTHPVGQKDPNAWGLYDMHGNVCEWCADWGGSYPSGSVTDPLGPSWGTTRVNRGGSWGTDARYCRSADRGYYDRPWYQFGSGPRNDYLGLRVALLPVQ